MSLPALASLARYAAPGSSRLGELARLFGEEEEALSQVEAARRVDGVSSVQISFHQDRDPASHSMPPGGFRLAIINATDLSAGQRARDLLKPDLFRM